MARLKGGKLLLDLTSYGDASEEIQHPLSDEEINTILSKGLSIKINFEGIILVIEPHITHIESDGSLIKYQTINDGSDNYEISLNLVYKHIDIVAL